jgi:hypothetical protein
MARSRQYPVLQVCIIFVCGHGELIMLFMLDIRLVLHVMHSLSAAGSARSLQELAWKTCCVCVSVYVREKSCRKRRTWAPTHAFAYRFDLFR